MIVPAISWHGILGSVLGGYSHDSSYGVMAVAWMRMRIWESEALGVGWLGLATRSEVEEIVEVFQEGRVRRFIAFIVDIY